MSTTRSLILLALTIAASFGSVCAQRRDRLPPPRDPQFYAPRNKLERKLAISARALEDLAGWIDARGEGVRANVKGEPFARAREASRAPLMCCASARNFITSLSTATWRLISSVVAFGGSGLVAFSAASKTGSASTSRFMNSST